MPDQQSQVARRPKECGGEMQVFGEHQRVGVGGAHPLPAFGLCHLCTLLECCSVMCSELEAIAYEHLVLK